MKKPVDKEFHMLCQEILVEGSTREFWDERPHDDGFQSENYCGGYFPEEEFFFRWWDEDDREYWFNLTMDDVRRIVSREITEFEIELKPDSEN